MDDQAEAVTRKKCAYCCQEFIKRLKESRNRFAERECCGRECGASLQAARRKGKKSRKKV